MTFMTKYPGEPWFVPLFPSSPDVVSIHAHRLEPGRFLVFEWFWDAKLGDYRQSEREPVNAPSLTNAVEYVPPGYDAIPSEGFAALVFKAVIQ